LRQILIFAAIAVTSLPRLFAADNSLDSSETLFTMLAALNAAGYNTAIDSPENSPLRKQLRDYLAQRKIPVVKDIHDFYAFKSPSIAPYLSLALSVTGPPDFNYRDRTVDVPPDAAALEPFVPLLVRFYQEAQIAELWKRVQPAFDAEIERYHEPLSNITLFVNSYLRSPSAGYMGRHFQVFIDLLAAPNQVQSRSYGNEYYVVVTPAKEPNIFELRHTYLHFVIEPLASKYATEIMHNASLSDYVTAAPGLEDSYKNDFLLLTTESLIKAVESRLDKKPALVKEALQQGFILTPYFADALAAYEKQPVAMKLYFPEVIANLDPVKERRRLEGVTFTAAPKKPTTTYEVPVPEPVLSPCGKVLALGDNAYAKKDWENARGYFLRALDLKGEAGEHAKAYYGLARVLLQLHKPEEAEQLLRKTVASSPDPQTWAWAEVTLGRLWDSQKDHEEAVKHYQAALDVKGASDQAHKAAEQGLQQPFTKPGIK
jgi:tetratricopeptide (TPR) repeat protein